MIFIQNDSKIIATMMNECQNKRPPKLNDFFLQHAVFTVDDLNQFLAFRGTNHPNTRKSLLTYYKNQGRIIRIRRGIYATIPPGTEPSTYVVDPFLVAAKLTPDSVLSYHTALEFYGKAYSVYSKLTYVSANRSLSFKFGSCEYNALLVPLPLLTKNKEMFGVTCHKRSGVEIRVTSLERTLVDVLDKPKVSGSWEEIWRSLESIEFFDLDQVIEYTLLLENATTVAKVGFFLDQHKDSLMVEEKYLNQLRDHLPKKPHYKKQKKRKDCKWIKSWNLMVPIEILNKSWEEVL